MHCFIISVHLKLNVQQFGGHKRKRGNDVWYNIAVLSTSTIVWSHEDFWQVSHLSAGLLSSLSNVLRSRSLSSTSSSQSQTSDGLLMLSSSVDIVNRVHSNAVQTRLALSRVWRILTLSHDQLRDLMRKDQPRHPFPIPGTSVYNIIDYLDYVTGTGNGAFRASTPCCARNQCYCTARRPRNTAFVQKSGLWRLLLPN